MLLTTLECYGLCPDNIITDGNIHRCRDISKPGNNDDGWYSIHPKQNGNILNFGSWLRLSEFGGIKGQTIFIGNDNTVIEAFQLDFPIQTPSPKPVINWAAKWAFLRNASNNGYTRAKGIIPYGLKCLYEKLVVPIFKPNGLSGLQYIEQDGNKYFGKGTSYDGGYHQLGQAEHSNQILFFEGFADTSSAFEFHNELGLHICCFSVYNLDKNVKHFSEKYPNKDLVIASDNDKVGIFQGNNVACKYNAKVAIPPGDDNDWNDIHKKYGNKQAANLFEQAITNPIKQVRLDLDSIPKCATALKKANEDELISTCEGIAKYVQSNVFPLELKHVRTMLENTLNKYQSKANTAIFNKCSGLLAISENQEQSQLDDKIADYLNIAKNCNNSIRIKKRKLVHGKYLPVSLAKYIVKLHVREKKHSFCIQAPLGCGKTELVDVIIKELDKLKLESNSQAVKVLYITPRTTLTNASAVRLNLNDYITVKNVQYDFKKDDRHWRLASTVNSIPGLIEYGTKYDLVVIDESELLISHILGNTIKDKQTALQHLYSLLDAAKTVICLDAFLGQNTIEMLRDADIKHITGIINEDKPWAETQVNWYKDDKRMLDNLVEDLKAKRHIGISTNSRTRAENIEATLKPLEDNGLVVTKKTVALEEQQLFIATPNEYALLYLYIIYTPTLESGISITTKEFERVYGFFEPMAEGVGTPLACVQQMARFRKAKEWSIFCPNRHFLDLPTDAAGITKTIIDRHASVIKCAENFSEKAVVEVDYPNDPVMHLNALNTRWENIQKQRFAYSILTFLQRMGCQMHLCEAGNEETGKELKQNGRELWLGNTANKLLYAPRFENEVDFNDFYENASQNEKAKACWTIERHIIEREYCVELTKDNIQLYTLLSKSNVLRQIKALETAILPFPYVDYVATYKTLGWDGKGKFKAHAIESIHNLPLQSKIRSLALQTVNFNEIWDNNESQYEWHNESLMKTDFYHFMSDNKVFINTQRAGFKVPDNFKLSPSTTFGKVLTQSGLLTSYTQPSSKGKRIRVYKIAFDKSLVNGDIIFTTGNLIELTKKRDNHGQNWVFKQAMKITRYRAGQEFDPNPSFESRNKITIPSGYSVADAVIQHLNTLKEAIISINSLAHDLCLPPEHLMYYLKYAIEDGTLFWQSGDGTHAGFISIFDRVIKFA